LQEETRGSKINLVSVKLEERGAIVRLPLMSPHEPQEGDIPLKSIDPQFQPLKLISLVSKVREKSVLHRPASVSWSYLIRTMSTPFLSKRRDSCYIPGAKSHQRLLLACDLP
jgi:hypothetical protein